MYNKKIREPVTWQSLIDILTYYATVKLLCFPEQTTGNVQYNLNDKYQALAQYYSSLMKDLNTAEETQNRIQDLKKELKQLHQEYLTQQDQDLTNDRALTKVEQLLKQKSNKKTSKNKLLMQELMLNSINSNWWYLSKLRTEPLSFLPVSLVLLLASQFQVLQAGLTLKNYEPHPHDQIKFPQDLPVLSILDQQNIADLLPVRYLGQLATNPITKDTIVYEYTLVENTYDKFRQLYRFLVQQDNAIN
ncbi:MAG: hypothetical protein [Caudoviricetes sp.]|nr:MAG: hypothetical protein [Caudoviricetes sp.]